MHNFIRKNVSCLVKTAPAYTVDERREWCLGMLLHGNSAMRVATKRRDLVTVASRWQAILLQFDQPDFNSDLLCLKQAMLKFD